MNRVVSLSLITLFLFIVAFAAYAYPGKHRGWHGKFQWWKDAELAEQLKLTDQQKSELEGIASSNKENMENLYSELKTNYKEFWERMKDPNSTRDEILTVYNGLQNTHRELGKVKVEMALDMREVLSPEQITKLAEIKEQHKQQYKGECRKDK
ncbi:MAG TPA: Spy/CpxP family protein refolding chaperone [Thermodesulfobacteriota bacterium]|nr:Spy/CpxP family protein refolding chaperone [Thermodesulfobacteriota bacterium]